MDHTEMPLKSIENVLVPFGDEGKAYLNLIKHAK